MAKEYHILKGKDKLGPLSFSEVVKIIDEQDLVWSEEVKDWVKPISIPELNTCLKLKYYSNSSKTEVSSDRGDVNESNITFIDILLFILAVCFIGLSIYILIEKPSSEINSIWYVFGVFTVIFSAFMKKAESVRLKNFKFYYHLIVGLISLPVINIVIGIIRGLFF
jgi:hypothetical protein